MPLLRSFSDRRGQTCAGNFDLASLSQSFLKSRHDLMVPVPWLVGWTYEHPLKLFFLRCLQVWLIDRLGAEMLHSSTLLFCQNLPFLVPVL